MHKHERERQHSVMAHMNSASCTKHAHAHLRLDSIPVGILETKGKGKCLDRSRLDRSELLERRGHAADKERAWE